MRFLFKTSYQQDLRLFQYPTQIAAYGILMIWLLMMPWVLTQNLTSYIMGQMVFILIYGIAGMGLMLLIGFTGQISLGHAAFLAVGAYTEVLLQARGVPFVGSLVASALFAGAVGWVVGLPALRLKGIYLGIATMSFGYIVEEIITRWDSVTGGNQGKRVPPIDLFGWKMSTDIHLYYLCLFLFILILWGLINLMRSPTGRAFVAIRDSEISAQSMGINLARTKTLAFVISAAITGVAGALYAHKISFVSPEQFTLINSIELATLVFIGGLGSFHGAVFGSIFIVVLPQLISISKDYLPEALASQIGFQPILFGGILIACLIFEPLGIYGRWVKIRTYFALFPLYRRGMFRRQKSFMRSDRLK